MLQQHYGKPPSELSKRLFCQSIDVKSGSGKVIGQFSHDFIDCKTNIAEVGSDWSVSILW